MIYGLSRDIEFEQVLYEDWVDYERNRFALDQSQPQVRSSGRVTREEDVRRVQLEPGKSFFHLREPVLRLRHLRGRLKSRENQYQQPKVDAF